MSDVAIRLLKCFRAVFGDVSDADLMAASQELLDTWDSIAAITLVNVIEEEFKIEFDYDRISDLDSFQKILDYVEDEVAISK